MGKFFRAIGRGLKRTFTTKAGLAAVGAGAALAFVPGLAPAVVKGLSAAGKGLLATSKSVGSVVKRGVTSNLVRGYAKKFSQAQPGEYDYQTPPFVPEPIEPGEYEIPPYAIPEETGEAYIDDYTPTPEELPAEAYPEPFNVRADELLVILENGTYYLLDPLRNEAWELEDLSILDEMEAA